MGGSWLCPNASPTSADDGIFDVVVMLTADRRPRGLRHPYPAGSLPDLNSPAVGLLLRCCNGLFVGIALDIDGSAMLFSLSRKYRQ
jgi:hypothetical protein